MLARGVAVGYHHIALRIAPQQQAVQPASRLQRGPAIPGAAAARVWLEMEAVDMVSSSPPLPDHLRSPARHRPLPLTVSAAMACVDSCSMGERPRNGLRGDDLHALGQGSHARSNIDGIAKYVAALRSPGPK